MFKFGKISIYIISTVLVLLIAFSLPIQVMAETLSVEISDETYDDVSEATNDEKNYDQGKIIGEDIASRDEYTKYFITDTGCTIVAQYGVPIHYKDDSGKYVNYDNTLITSQATVSIATTDESTINEATVDELSLFSINASNVIADTFINKKSDSKVTHFKESDKSKLIEIERNGHKISWTYSGVNKVTARESMNKNTEELTGDDSYLNLTNLSSTLIYNNIYNNVDLEVINFTTGVKENLILKASNTKNVFKIEYNIGGLIAESVDVNTIVLKDVTGKTVYIISAPYMKDSNGETSEALELKILSNNKGKLSVKLTADKTWLKDKTRAYPVTVDPSILYKSNPEAVSCTYIDSADTNTPNGNEWYVYAGTLEDGEELRSLVRINNLPILSNGDMIVSASANLVLIPESLTTTSYVGLYEITKQWDENNDTWNTFAQANSEGYDHTLIDYEKFVSGQSTQWVDWDITELVKNWYNGSANNGFMLKFVDGTSLNQCIRFASSFFGGETTDQDYINSRPCFTLSYRNNKGLENHWSYTSVNCGRAGIAHINDYSGNLTFCMPLASTASPLLPAELSYIFNSYCANNKYTTTSPYTGLGWKMNIQQTVKVTSSSVLGDNQSLYPYVYTDADGTEHYFYKKTEDGVTKYYDEDGLDLELFITSSYYKIVDKDNNSLIFSENGYLTSICDKTNNRVEVNYSGNNIEFIVDPEGDIIDFTPNNTTNNYVEKITDSDGKVTTISFTGARITQVTYNDGLSVQFAYDSTGRLTSVTDVDGSKIAFAYTNNDSKGVVSVTEYGTEGTQGQKITFNREKYNTTTIRTSGAEGTFGTDDDIITEYQYDNFGRTTSSNSKNVYGEYLSASGASYTSGTPNSTGSDIKTLNKIKQGYTVGANRENLVIDGSFEKSSWSTYWNSGWLTSSDITYNITHNSSNLYGNKSIGITSTACSSSACVRMYQDFPVAYLEQGKTYTLSGYIKVSDITPASGATNYGAYLCAMLCNSDNTVTSKNSDYVTSVTDTEINGGFRRVSVTFNVPTGSNFSYLRVNLAFRGATGTACFEAIQLEKSDAPSPFNMIENASFERTGPALWSKVSTTSADGVVSGGIEGSQCAELNGTVVTSKSFIQDIPISGNDVDTYILSGWGKGEAVPNETNATCFEVRAKVFYSDGSGVEKGAAKFNTTIGDWQYSSLVFNLDNNIDSGVTPSKIRVYAIIAKEDGTFLFDNLMLTKEAVPSYTYDDEGNLISVVANAEQKSNYSYTDNDEGITPEDNLLTKYINPNNKEYDYKYYDNKQIKSVTIPSGITVNYTYDNKGNANSVELTHGDLKLSESLTYTYGNGTLPNYSVKAKNQRGKESTWRYDAKDGTLTGYTDPQGNTTTYSYYSRNDMLRKITSGDQSVSYDYDAFYKYRTGITHGNTNYYFTYDQFGNKLTTSVGNRTLSTNSYLGNNGNLNRVTYGNGDYTEYEYNCFGGVSLIKQNGLEVAENYINSRGDVIRSVDKVNNLEYRSSVDTIGRLITKDVYSAGSSTNSNTWRRSVEYDYDTMNNLSKLTLAYNDGTHNRTWYTYTDDNLPLMTVLNNNESLSFRYDGLNRVTKKILNTPTKVTTEYTYVNIGANTANVLDTEVSNAFAYSYFYDNNGNITSIQNGTKQSDGSYSYSTATGNVYTYDRYNQLIRDLDKDNGTSTHYEYDINGNITKRIVDKWDVENNVRISNLITDYFTYNDSKNWGDLLTRYTESGARPVVECNLTYDEIGNPLNYRNGITMTWQNGRELASLSKDGKTLNFTYDPDGLRTKKSITFSTGSTTNVEYIYEGGLLIQMTYGSYVLDFSYDSNGTPIGFHAKTSGLDKYYYYGVNSRGDVEALYNEDGTLHAKYEYDAYGKLMSVKASDGTDITATYAIAVLNPLRYRSYVYDNESGLYYLQSRYYDPTTCRFINADVYYETGQGITGYNMFAYCNNNPVMFSDAGGTYVTYSGITYGGQEFHNVPAYQLGLYGQIKDYWVDGDVVPEVEYGFTYSNGLGVSANVGYFAFTGQGGISIDAEGNIGIQFTISYSINASVTGSDYGASVGSYNMFTNAQDIYRLEGDGYQLGVGATAPIPYTSMNGFAESNLVILPTANPNKCYMGYSDFKGISTIGSADFNAHFTGGYTFETQWSINIFDIFGG